MPVPAGDVNPLTDALDTALGRRERVDPVRPGSGGPAGNALFTAWLGLALLVLFFLEGLTLVDVRGLITWHVALGAVLVPPVLAKAMSTGWRILRYYSGQPQYRVAGPPPLLLRLLGPLVVATSLLLLGSGVALVLLGEESSHRAVVTVPGIRMDWIGVHKAAFVAWLVVMTAHVLARTIPAYRLATSRRPVPGISRRVVALALAFTLAAGTAVWLVRSEGSWTHGRSDDHDDRSSAVVDR